ncbi:tetratricopeptide repeat protein [Dysgonomonas sp. Marseille-P4677]|uniref:tetratricopeptide repeat protein n=1 Tax=Dysgonomonas sp. Marseille-P4677 TaxID=2364790 RepID=UPI001913DEA8|nr:tetratricopeptide repeat protein [Dysgonomonas sp. Marseille-P4677]MBK5721597.1 tetratricopeptide repeat protein [Dysgonomonas sp. Marseille-P4677]
MKKILFIILLISITISISAQKQVRKAVRTGNRAYNEQRYGAAEAEYNKALKENAGSKEASFNLANTYYKQQKWDEALKEYQHYLTLENEDETKMSAAWSNMGNTFLKKKANEKAQQPMMQGGQPQQGGQQADNLKMSMDAYKNALRLNPKDEETRYNLAVVQKMIKDKEDQDKDQNKDQNKDQKQDQKDQNKDQNKDQDKDPKQDKQDQKQDQNQMSQDNIQQILQAIEQDEKDTQERVKQAKAQERKQKNENNKRQNKDW